MKKSITANNARVWPIKGVEMDTRTVLKKAAKKQGKTLGEFLNQEIREYASGLLKSQPKPPMKIEEVAYDVENLKKQMESIAQKLEQQPRSFGEMLFGKKKSNI